ncbi:MAG: hypothetical protein AUI02_02210 [Acidobacteria bacterium 13_2_20CM_2_57_12]|nr:MAG: hypothetical protein AUI02_02210 [Acidobacteria bacterium 13_2_20CM_2_57_12]
MGWVGEEHGLTLTVWLVLDLISGVRAESGSSLRVLLVHISPRELPSFVRQDLELLRENFAVTPFFFRGPADIPRLFKEVARHDLAICWFTWDNAYYASWAAALFQRPMITIPAGFRDASRLTGREDIRLVYLGFDSNYFPFGTEDRRGVLTVGDVTISNLDRKGMRTFVRAAAHAKDEPFWVAGRVYPEALEAVGYIPDNVKFLGWLPQSELLSLMQRASVYVQVSAHEGFGCSLAEAMLCGCIPVVTNRGAIPEVVGDEGVYVEYGQPVETAEGIKRGLQSPVSLRARVRERIVSRFPIRRRKEALAGAVRELIG